jgi:hypothetical protein
MATLKDALASLAAVAPKTFARERDALAARLRDAGDTTAAAQVKARRVPTLPVWVVNRLALEHPDDVEALIAAAARVKAIRAGPGVYCASPAALEALHSPAVCEDAPHSQKIGTESDSFGPLFSSSAQSPAPRDGRSISGMAQEMLWT